jgi:radical SAM-linked protein
MFKQRILIRLSVRGDIRFVSHHDLMRVLGRAARRAGLPVAMSQGFNPRQKISLLLARGVGVASAAEFAEMDLDEWVGAGEVGRRLNETLPEGLRVERAVLANPHERHRATRVDCRGPLGLTDADARALLERREVTIERRRQKAGRPERVKRVDIRPFIRDVRVDAQCVAMSLVVSDAGTTRPEEVYAALGGDAECLLRDCTITRTDMTVSPSI